MYDNDGVVIYCSDSIYQCILGSISGLDIKVSCQTTHTIMPRLKVISIGPVPFHYVSFAAVSGDEDECYIFSGSCLGCCV